MRFIYALLLLIFLGTSVASAATKDPDAQLTTFLETLRTRKYDGALTNFFTGSLTGQQKTMELKAMDGQVKAALEFYGPPMSWEIVETKKIGKDLVNIKFVSKHKDEMPMFWNALFYRRHEAWEPLGIYFFDDPRKAGFW